jgi:hypothetical protein
VIIASERVLVRFCGCKQILADEAPRFRDLLVTLFNLHFHPAQRDGRRGRIVGNYQMYRTFGVATTTAAIGIAALSLTEPAHAGNGSAVGVGLVGFGIGAILGSMLAPPEVYFIPPPPPDYYDYYGPIYYGPPPAPPRPHNNRLYPRSSTTPSHAATNNRQTGPISTKAAKTETPTSAAQKVEAKFKAAQAKAKRNGVQTLTQADIEGLSSDQIKQLRGY